MSRGLAIWLAIMLAETLHGILRERFLVPLTGAAAAARIGWPTGLLLVLLIAALLVPWTGLRDRMDLLRLGGLWVALTFGFESLVGVLRGFSASRIVQEFNPATGGLGLLTLLAMFLAPLAAARLRGLR